MLKYSIDYHIKYFEEIAKKLSGYTYKCVISFVYLYRNTQNNMKNIDLIPMNLNEMFQIAQGLASIAKKYNISLESCAEKIELTQFGINHGHCIDGELFEKFLGCKLEVSKDKNQRVECGCMSSIDIGMYNTCKNGCRYCYANFSPKTVAKQFMNHDPSSPLISGVIGEDDIVKEKVVKSCKNCQLKLF